jgi:hypothetical protein
MRENRIKGHKIWLNELTPNKNTNNDSERNDSENCT